MRGVQGRVGRRNLSPGLSQKCVNFSAPTAHIRAYEPAMQSSHALNLDENEFVLAFLAVTFFSKPRLGLLARGAAPGRNRQSSWNSATPD